MNRFAAVVSSLLLCSGVAVCQYSAYLDTSAGTSHLTMRFRAESFSGPTITGAPYSAEEVDENQQTLADGTHITQVMPTVKKYRDSMGRTRTERQPFNEAITSGSQHLELPMLVEVEAGSIGNDRLLIETHEYWRSPALKLEILSTSDDPRSGQHTHKVTNLNTSEPDAALFQPPPGYTVKDETGEFEISWSTP